MRGRLFCLIAVILALLCAQGLPGRAEMAPEPSAEPFRSVTADEYAGGSAGPADAPPAERGESANMPIALDEITLFLNSREVCDPSAGARYVFISPHTGRYLFCGLPGVGDVGALTVTLTLDDGTTVASLQEKDTFELAVDLNEGVRYTLSVTGAGGATLVVEVMEDAYGRCVDQPIHLEDQAHYNRAIVEPRDTHWYAFTTARSGWYTFRAVTEGGLNAPDTRAALLDRDRREVAFADDVLFPDNVDFRLFAYINAYETYYLRVCADSNQTGAYQLIISTAEDSRALPRSISLTRDALTLKPGMSAPLAVTANPPGALHPVSWASDRPDICTVTQDGLVTAVSAGTAVIHAFSGRLEATTTVTVAPVALTGLRLAQTRIEVPQGTSAALQPIFTPENASDTSLTYTTDDPAIATVTGEGIVTGVSPGVTRVTAASAGGLTDACEVVVTERLPVYRALVLGEQNYDDGRVRLGGMNTALGVADMLCAQSVNGRTYSVTLRVDSTRAELLDAIDEAFDGAQEGDLSLIYINCHGDWDGTAWIELHDGTRVTADQLCQLLSRVPGRVAVVIDCCRSGSFLGRAEAADRFTETMTRTIGAGGGSPLNAGRFIVLTSAGPDEDSYRRSFTSATTEESMATIMARSLCEGAGWDLIEDRVCTLKADADRDRVVTAQELWQYARKRVAYYLSGTGVSQSVRLWPEGDQTPLFGKGRD